MARQPLLIGCGAGFSGDRPDAPEAVVATLSARGGPACLMLETLAERTLALAQLRRREDPQAGYEPLLDRLVGPVLAECLGNGIRIVSNFGAANPTAAARRIDEIARIEGFTNPRIAVVTGDDLSGPAHHALLAERLGEARHPVSANAYLGAEPIAAAWDAGAEIIVTGRVADPSLAVGPAMAHYGWSASDWDRLGRATMAGHLLECGAQVTGGYFADPGYKDVPDIANVGFPIAEVSQDGDCIIGKADRTGGCVTLATVKEQLLYEVHDPAAYLTPDVTADITQAQVTQAGTDLVALTGVRGHERPATLKVTAFYEGGWLAEGGISYAGPGAEARARLAAEILAKRLPELKLRIDLIGVTSLFADDAGRLLAAKVPSDARDVRLRVAARHDQKEAAERLAQEVTALYTCGPAGGGGVRTAIRPRLSTASCFVPREAVKAGFEWVD
ncbi:MAG: DUF1446 domain-containing protein [Burkholderiales bacterium]|nr:DUF1446 domain-containing protein [Burkholderiales bacterium]